MTCAYKRLMFFFSCIFIDVPEAYSRCTRRSIMHTTASLFSRRLALFNATQVYNAPFFFGLRISLFTLSIRYSMSFFSATNYHSLLQKSGEKSRGKIYIQCFRVEKCFSLFWVLLSRFCAIHFYYAFKQCLLFVDGTSWAKKKKNITKKWLVHSFFFREFVRGRFSEIKFKQRNMLDVSYNNANIIYERQWTLCANTLDRDSFSLLWINSKYTNVIFRD